MQLGFAALHFKGVRPEKGIKSPHKTRPRAYVSGQAARRPRWWDAFAISADIEPQQKSKYWCLNTENKLITSFTLLFIF